MTCCPNPSAWSCDALRFFAGDFTAEAASLVAAGGEIAASEVVRSLASLVTKSSCGVGRRKRDYALSAA